MNLTREQVLQWTKETGTCASVSEQLFQFATLARAELEATIAEQATEISNLIAAVADHVTVRAEQRQKITEQAAEIERLKEVEQSALKVCNQIDEVVIALPFDYLDPPDGGDVSLGEQVRRMYEEVKTLRHAVVTDRQQLAASQAYAEQIRECLDMWLLATVNDRNKYAGARAITRKELAIPHSTTTLQEYGANLVEPYKKDAAMKENEQ